MDVLDGGIGHRCFPRRILAANRQPSGICRYLTVRPVVSARLRMSLRPRPGTFHSPERREEASSMLDEAALSGARDGVAAAATPWPGPDSSVSWTADRWLLSLHLGDGTGTGPPCNGCPWGERRPCGPDDEVPGDPAQAG